MEALLIGGEINRGTPRNVPLSFRSLAGAAPQRTDRTVIAPR